MVSIAETRNAYGILELWKNFGILPKIKKEIILRQNLRDIVCKHLRYK
jgi:hypothetical protein